MLEHALSFPCALTAAGKRLEPSTEPHRHNLGLRALGALGFAPNRSRNPKPGAGRGGTGEFWVPYTARLGAGSTDQERGWGSLGSRNEMKRLHSTCTLPGTHQTWDRGSNRALTWNYMEGDGDSWIQSTYKVYAAYLLDSTNHCALIRQNIKADSTRSFKTIFVNENDWVQWGDLSEPAIREESFLPIPA